MPKNHRNQRIDGPHLNCAVEGCGNKGEYPVGGGARLCPDCNNDYRTYLPYMEEGQYPSWETK